MGAPGTIVEGAEKPVMRAVVVWVRRDVRVVRRARGRMVVCFVVGGFAYGCSGGWFWMVVLQVRLKW